MTLYTLNYNNYYNRIKKGFNTIDEYGSYVLESFEGVSFNPNDGVATSQILNLELTDPDYLIVVNEDNEIVSRWFIIESSRVREGQYNIQLLRDVIQDWREEVLSSPSVIHKGYLASNDPGIFVPEDVVVNQIKKSERLLKDNSRAAWLVGYLAPASTIAEGADDTEGNDSIHVEYGGKATTDIYLSTPITEWEYYQYSGEDNAVEIKLYDYADFRVTYLNSPFKTHAWGILSNGGTSYLGDNFNQSGLYTDEYIDPTTKKVPTTLFVTKTLGTLDLSSCRSAIERYYDVERKEGIISNLQRQVGIVEDSTGKQYAVSIIHSAENFSEALSYNPQNIASNALYGVVQNINDAAEEVNGYSNTISYSAGSATSFDITGVAHTYKFKIEEFTLTSGHELEIPGTTKNLLDAPYRMFCIPYEDGYKISGTVNDAPITLTSTKINSLALATSIMTSAGAFCYDVQLLPYCPLRRIRDAGFTGLNLSDIGTEGVDYVLATDTNSIIIFCDQSKDTFDIPFSQTILSPNDTIGVKTKALTSFSRLCSPNYSGMFEYSPIKNGGVTSINVDIDYKPYNPYIHLNINFGGIYGKDFNDARGLICGGDFSITRVDSAWTQYQLQNKNYNEIFNKGIDKMEFEAKYAKTQDIANAITGSVQGAVSGAMTGAMSSGSPWGAIAGGVIGGGAAIGGGIADVVMNEKMRRYNIDFAKDMQELSLGNIQAMPYSLSKVSTFNNNNKIWPFVENYECTLEEYQAIYDKIKYTGMTVNRIGTLDYYIQQKPYGLDYGFFQTTPIRLNVAHDSHICNAIATELAQGVFL